MGNVVVSYAGHSEGDGNKIKVLTDYDDRQHIVDASSEALFIVSVNGEAITNPVPWKYAKRVAFHYADSFTAINDDGSITEERSAERNPGRRRRG